MTAVDDLLEPLQKGIWEVRIPKENITEQLDERWILSPINVPTPGTVASYRKGQYHLHETKTEWKVHLDRHDPKLHPLLHLIDDAPLFLMISETIQMLFSEISGTTTNMRDRLEDQQHVLIKSIYLGVFLLLLGLTFIISPKVIYYGTMQVILPLVVIIAGIGTIIYSIQISPFRISNRDVALNGGKTILIGIILAMVPQIFWDLLLITILGAWMLASALMLLNRAVGGKSAIPEGFYSRLAIAVISLILGITMIYAPATILKLFMMIVGVIIILAGGVLISSSYNLKQIPESATRDQS